MIHDKSELLANSIVVLELCGMSFYVRYPIQLNLMDSK